MANVVDIAGYEPTKSDQFFFDTNVWISLLFEDQSGHASRHNDRLSAFFTKTIANCSTILITPVVVSEFVHAYFKVDANHWGGDRGLDRSAMSSTRFFKHEYRQSDRYEKTKKKVRKLIARQMLRFSEPVPEFLFAEEGPKITLEETLETMEDVGDFNDAYFVELAYKLGLKLVTNDADFGATKRDVTILTPNRKMLAS